MSKREPKSRNLSGWALELSEYDFDIEHVQSRNNGISDCLSRLHLINLLTHLQPEMSVEEFHQAQLKDFYLMAAFDYLATNRKNFDVDKLGPFKRFCKHLNLDPTGLLQWKYCTVVPEHLRNCIIELCYDHPASGHFAIDRTLSHFKECFYWPNALKDVTSWVRGCVKCNAFNTPPGGYVRAPLNPINSSERFETICYDIAGPFMPVTPRGNRYALILVDHFTKWTEAIALPDIQALTIARAIYDQWCCRYGLMKFLHSDGASNVDGHVVRELCKLLGIGKTKSSRLHPQGDGISESMVKVLKSCIQKQVDLHGLNWDLYLHSAMYAARTSVNSSKGFAPSQMVLGSHIKLPVDLLTTNDVNDLQDKPQNHSQRQAQQFVSQFGKEVKRTFVQAQASLNTSRNKMKIQYDKKTTSHQFKVGDYVMLWYPYKVSGLSQTWQPNWKGPFQIHCLVGNCNCILVNGGGRLSQVIHVNQLKLVLPPNNRLELPKYQATITQPQKASQVQSDNSVADLFISAEDENNPTEVSVTENRTVMGNQQLIQRNWCELDTASILPNRTRSGKL